MRLIFISNYFNHHQHSFCDALFDALGDDFIFLENTEMDSEKRALGWRRPERPYLKRTANLSKGELAKYLLDCDILFFGAVPLTLVKERLRSGKLSFFYTERVFKKGDRPSVTLPRKLKYRYNFAKADNCFLLAAGEYCVDDFKRMGLFRDRIYSWGYFPEFREHRDKDEMFDDKEPRSIVWAGRFIDWKHPEMAIFAAKRLKDAGVSFTLTMVGGGQLLGQTKE